MKKIGGKMSGKTINSKKQKSHENNRKIFLKRKKNKKALKLFENNKKCSTLKLAPREGLYSANNTVFKISNKIL